MLRSSGNKQAGFTLLEMLIALFLFSLLSAGATLALTQTLTTQDRLKSAQSVTENIAVQRSILVDDLTHFSNRPARNENGQFRPYRLVVSQTPLLAFVRGGRANPGGLQVRPSEQYIEYDFVDGALIRRAWPINPAPDAVPHERVMVSDLLRVDVTLLRDQSETRQIFSPRGDTQTLPPLLEMTLVWPDGKRVTHIVELGS